jgi:DNA-binding transcriptional MocR family regulator
MDYARFLTATALRRRPSPIRALQPLVSRPGMISLGGGMPNPGLFPYTGISFTLADGTELKATPGDVKEALQYSPTPGLPELVKRLAAVQQAEHKPPRPASLAVVPGSQDGLAKLFDALVSAGDAVLVEAPTYSGSLAFLEATGCKLVGIPTDGGGIRVDALAATLEGWDERRQVRTRVWGWGGGSGLTCLPPLTSASCTRPSASVCRAASRACSTPSPRAATPRARRSRWAASASCTRWRRRTTC